jgi:hypothetical protein
MTFKKAIGQLHLYWLKHRLVVFIVSLTGSYFHRFRMKLGPEAGASDAAGHGHVQLPRACTLALAANSWRAGLNGLTMYWAGARCHGLYRRGWPARTAGR